MSHKSGHRLIEQEQEPAEDQKERKNRCGKDNMVYTM